MLKLMSMIFLALELQEFRRTRNNISSMREHAELLTSVRNDISEYKVPSISFSHHNSIQCERIFSLSFSPKPTVVQYHEYYCVIDQFYLPPKY